MRRIDLAIALLGLISGLLAGIVDMRNDEVQATVLVVLTATFLLGYSRPGRAWLWALLVGCGVPGVHLAGMAIGIRPSYPVEPNVLATFLALIPALIGAYAGAGLRWAGFGLPVR